MALDRRGIELPVSFIIILVVSMIVFGLGAGVTYTLVCGAEDQLASLSAQQQQEVERRLLTGPAVIIPDATKNAEQPSSICGGASVPGASYALGIRNDGNTQTTYTIECSYKGIEAVSAGSVCDADIVQFRPTVMIEPREREVLAVVVNVDPSTLPGRHVYTMTVTDQNDATFERSVNFYLDVE